MPVVAKTDFVNSTVSIGKDTEVELVANDGFRHNTVVVNTDNNHILWMGGEDIKTELKTKGIPLFPGQSFSTTSISKLYGIADDSISTGILDIRIQTEEEDKSFAPPNMNGAV